MARLITAKLILLAVLIASDARADSASSPYSADAQHLWNRLHRALFVRTAGGVEYSHSTDPYLYRDGTYLLKGPAHQRAVDLLNEFVAAPFDPEMNAPLKRLILQHDLWALFDYAVGGDEGWVRPAGLLPGALALREPAGMAIKKLLLSDREVAELPDNYAAAVKSGEFAAADDASHPERAFLPADLFDPAGPWVRFHNADGAQPMGKAHFRACGGRAVHMIFLRLPGGREATERYLRALNDGHVDLFPAGTMVALVRRPLVITRSLQLRVAPVTEMVQIRVYRRVRGAGEATRGFGSLPEQSAHEFLLDRPEFLAGQPGLREVTSSTALEQFLREGIQIEELLKSPMREFPVVGSCAACHSQGGVGSVISIAAGLAARRRDLPVSFRTLDLNTELGYTIQAKTEQPEWDILQKMLREAASAKKR